MANSSSSPEKRADNNVPGGLIPLVPDPNLVTWEGPDDPQNPKNWPATRKWMTFVPMSFYNLLSSMSSATVAPALSAISEDLGFPSKTLLILSLSIFYLGSAIVPLFTAPISEMAGRVPVLLAMNVIYIVFNTACGAAKSPTQLIIFRFLAGLGAAGPYGIGSGMNSDLFQAHERGKAIAVFTLAPLVGTAVGPITGGFLVQYVSWRWCFYVISIAIAAVQVAGLLLLRETYGPVLLKRKAARLRKTTGNQNLHTEHDRASTLLMKNLIRPFRLLITQPIVQVLSLYLAYLNGILYLMVATFPDVWTGIYHESISIGSLNYLSMTVGLAIATQLGVRYADKVYQRLRAENNGHAKPEFRLPTLCVVALVVPVGLFWYGWSARINIHWIMPNIGAAIYSGATVVQLVCVQGYLIDTYQLYAASAMASVMVLRNLLGFALPLVAPSLYGNLGFAWGNTLLACVAVVIGIPAPVLLWYYGEALRGLSTYARS
ncbi:major facilitator superfamily domain-containing protein [Aspergillus alliaceus]|uniref:Major facilitator superfamily domain-containing protein n=1 Tax=Petromyces alliaceus TaxID=209559 RepID=A0A5N6FJ43_PETAA|nr:major facilitator superfamily domain-containing protein [Aspergillus alliaceus]KAB8228940.1 major facilitator superfamily domain-containing protein [Aspergillus alliaceus]KAE8389504.1 major facilitator superfamily domain-containing protein [Aspergillus alliaceus]